MDLTEDRTAALPGPLRGEGVWPAAELPERPEWNHHLESGERQELLDLLELLDEGESGPTVRGRPMEQATALELSLPTLAGRLATIQQQLEEGAGAVRMHGFPIEGLNETQARLLYWTMALQMCRLEIERFRLIVSEQGMYIHGDIIASNAQSLYFPVPQGYLSQHCMMIGQGIRQHTMVEEFQLVRNEYPIQAFVRARIGHNLVRWVPCVETESTGQVRKQRYVLVGGIEVTHHNAWTASWVHG